MYGMQGAGENPITIAWINGVLNDYSFPRSSELSCSGKIWTVGGVLTLFLNLFLFKFFRTAPNRFSREPHV